MQHGPQLCTLRIIIILGSRLVRFIIFVDFENVFGGKNCLMFAKFRRRKVTKNYIGTSKPKSSGARSPKYSNSSFPVDLGGGGRLGSRSETFRVFQELLSSLSTKCQQKQSAKKLTIWNHAVGVTDRRSMWESEGRVLLENVPASKKMNNIWIKNLKKEIKLRRKQWNRWTYCTAVCLPWLFPFRSCWCSSKFLRLFGHW